MENETKESEQKKEESMPSLIELADRIEKANAEAKVILAEQKELVARNLLGGQTNAGIQPPPVKEETNVEYRKRVIGF